VSLGSRLDMVPRSLSKSGENIIAPLAMDFDLSGSRGSDDSGVIYYNAYEYFDINKIGDDSIKNMYNRVRKEVVSANGDNSFIPTMVATISWIRCPRFPYNSSKELNEVNIILITASEPCNY